MFEPNKDNCDASNRESTIGFSLPTGLSVGGVTTWSVNMTCKLNERGLSATILKHVDETASQMQVPTSPFMKEIDCGQLSFDEVQFDDLQTYMSILPALFVPNAHEAAYATCAEISRRHAAQMRVIGMCHSAGGHDYQWLCFYEPIIHKFIAVSRECGTELKRLLPARADDIVVRPYCVSVPPKLQREYSQPARPLRLLYAGRLVHFQKRVLDFLVLAKRLVEHSVNFELEIVGNGPDEDKLQEAFRKLDDATQARVKICEAIAPEDMPARMMAADVSVLVSDTEGTSVTMLESMASGCVPVVTDVSGVKDVIRYGENGFYLPVGDFDAMATVIQKLDRDRELLPQMGNAAHETSKKYGYDEYLDWFQTEMNEVWSAAPRRWPFFRATLPNPCMRARVHSLAPHWFRTLWRQMRGTA